MSVIPSRSSGRSRDWFRTRPAASTAAPGRKPEAGQEERSGGCLETEDVFRIQKEERGQGRISENPKHLGEKEAEDAGAPPGPRGGEPSGRDVVSDTAREGALLRARYRGQREGGHRDGGDGEGRPGRHARSDPPPTRMPSSPPREQGNLLGARRPRP